MSFNITFLRHGKAEKSFSNDHRLHPLSDEGVLQARRRREMLGKPKYDLVLHSPLLRAKETAIIVAGLETEQFPETYQVHSLYPEESDPRIVVLNELFEELGYSPLEEYEKKAKKELDSLAADMKADVWELIVQAFCCGDRIKNVLIVGHAVLLQALCQVFAGRISPYAQSNPGECEGFEVKVTSMRRVDPVRSLK